MVKLSHVFPSRKCSSVANMLNIQGGLGSTLGTKKKNRLIIQRKRSLEVNFQGPYLPNERALTSLKSVYVVTLRATKKGGEKI